MRTSRRLTAPVAWLSIALCGLSTTAARAAGERTVLENVTVVDTRTGRLAAKRAVVIEGGKIAGVIPSRAVKLLPGDKVVDGRGAFVVPGYNDMHTHPLNPGDTVNQLRMMLSLGITGFRQMSGSPALLEKRQAGTLMPPGAPTLLATSGSLLIGGVVGSPAAAAADVRRQHAEGADFIKAINLPPAVLNAAHREAKELGLTVTGHLSPLVDPFKAAATGMDGIEHLGPGDSLLLGCSSRGAELRAELHPQSPPPGRSGAASASPRAEAAKIDAVAATPPPPVTVSIADPLAFTPASTIVGYGKVLDSYEAHRCRLLARTLAADGVWNTPTLIRLRTMEFADDPGYAEDPNVRYVSRSEVAAWRFATDRFHSQMTASAKAALSRLFAAQLALTKLFYDNHVPMMTGDDAAGAGWIVAGYGLHQEFDLLALAGLPPLAVLQMTTINPARYLHREAMMGTVEPGRVADLVLLAGNPLANVANLHRLTGVVHDGRYYSADDLAALRRQTEEAER